MGLSTRRITREGHVAAITRKPQNPGYNELGGENTHGDDFLLYADGIEIATTYYCPASYVADGQRWASDGPAGLSMGHRTREDAEKVQVDAHLANPVPAAIPAPEEGPADDLAPLPMSYEQALAEAEKRGVSKCGDPALMASLCDGPLQTLVGAVSPRLVWEGAQKKGLTSKELLRLCRTDVIAVSDLMWL